MTPNVPNEPRACGDNDRTGRSAVGSIRLVAGHDVYLKIDFAIVAWTPFV